MQTSFLLFDSAIRFDLVTYWVAEGGVFIGRYLRQSGFGLNRFIAIFLLDFSPLVASGAKDLHRPHEPTLFSLSRHTADRGTHFRSTEFAHRSLLGGRAKELRVSLNFASKQHGKGEYDGRFNVVKTPIGPYGSQQKRGRLRSEKDIGRKMAEAVRKGSLRTDRNISLPILYCPKKKMPPGKPKSPLFWSFQAVTASGQIVRKMGRACSMQPFAKIKKRPPLRHIMPALGREILQVNPSRGHVGFKRAISGSARKMGGKDASLTGSSQKLMRHRAQSAPPPFGRHTSHLKLRRGGRPAECVTIPYV